MVAPRSAPGPLIGQTLWLHHPAARDRPRRRRNNAGDMGGHPMRFRPSAVVHQGMAVAITAALACLVAPAAARAQNAYITNSGSGTVSVIATATNSTVNIAVGERPSGVALGG